MHVVSSSSCHCVSVTDGEGAPKRSQPDAAPIPSPAAQPASQPDDAQLTPAHADSPTHNTARSHHAHAQADDTAVAPRPLPHAHAAPLPFRPTPPACRAARRPAAHAPPHECKDVSHHEQQAQQRERERRGTAASARCLWSSAVQRGGEWACSSIHRVGREGGRGKRGSGQDSSPRPRRAHAAHHAHPRAAHAAAHRHSKAKATRAPHTAPAQSGQDGRTSLAHPSR